MTNKVEPHAAELERIADQIAASGISGHPTALRTMAAELRANADTAAPAPAPRGLTAISPMQAAAANPELKPLLRNLRARAERLGLEWDDSKPIDPRAVDKAFRNGPIFERLQWKADAAKLGLYALVD